MTSRDIIDQLKIISNESDLVNEATGEFLYTEDEVQAMYEELDGIKEDKLIAIQDYFLSKTDEIQRLKDKKAKLDAGIKRVQKEQEQLRYYQNLLLNGEKLKTDEYNFFYKTTKSVQVGSAVDISSLPLEMYTTKFIADKAAIKKELEKGWTKEGIELTENTSLSVR